MTGGLGLGAEQDFFTEESNKFPRDPLLQVAPFTRQIEDDFGVVRCQI